MGYRESVLDPAVEDPNHPINHGFQMQVHHLLSKAGVKKTGDGPKLKSYGYDINLPGNLVALPCTLEGACHLQVQLHRGSHPNAIDTNDNDKEHPKGYHRRVTYLIKNAYKTISKRCEKQDNPGIQRYMDYHSLLILREIRSFELSLSNVAEAFKRGGVGCLGATTVPELWLKLKASPKECTCNGRKHDKFSSFNEIPYNLERGK
ncbi:AHH domain-containing protein [Vibrio neptunius]|uniref:AHH domain-containing protein n=1 Tax=Vibrio neptunius TaxID=170651 RepID=UPI0019D21607|nr:AHH domain-containing protein [Vibrio neptunius]MBN3573585.1 AHH domain-containing protein [Vibrio neptunius]